MRVLLVVLLVGVVGCGGDDNSPDDVAVPSSPAVTPVKSENAEAGAPPFSTAFSPVKTENATEGAPKAKADESPAQAAVEQKATAKKAVEVQETLTLTGHSDDVYSVSFSPDGKRIVSGSWDKTLKVWDAQTGQETLTLKGHSNSVESVSFSPDGKRIVSGSWDNTLKVWDISSLDTSK